MTVRNTPAITHSEKKPLSLKFKIFLYFLIFTVIMLCILWLTQTVLLDRFYHAIKVKEVKAAAQTLQTAIYSQSEKLDEQISTLCTNNQICIEIDDASFAPISLQTESICYSNGAPVDCCVHSNRMFMHKHAQMTKARNEGSPQFCEMTAEDAPWSFAPAAADSGASLLEYVSYTESKEGDGYYLTIVSKVSTLSATAQTLRFQLLLVTGLMLLIALFLAWFLSRFISRPITKITNSAGELAQGNYNADFSGEGYLEIEQLGNSLQNAADQLEKVDKLKDELIANISHDLRTPLTMITGYAEVMRDIPGENTPENVQIIIDEATRLTTLVNAVMDLSKARAGASGFSPAPLCLTDLIADIVQRYQKMTEVKQYIFRFEANESVWVSADSGQLQQVLYNLINNAVNYCGEDRTITVRQTRCGEDNAQVRIEVIDTGAGIAKENLTLIWDRYYKENKNHKRAVIGTGLGLSIVKNILELHRARYGVISDDSPNHHGSDFWFELPIISQPTSETDETK